MYLYHFGIKKLPFTLTPNTQFYFGLPSHNEALDVLRTALDSGEGFIKVTGEVGTGKSLICRKLLNELSDGFVPAYVPNPMLSPDALRRVVANELNVDLSDVRDQQEYTLKIQQHLVKIRRQNKAVVLIIDEAQALPDESIEALRLMTNLETESNKLMQVVLFGQPELDVKISKPHLRQLKQRITFSYQLQTMDSNQTFQYLKHRMLTAGHKTGEVFQHSTIKALIRFTKGTPRLVNIIAHKALMLAYGEGVSQVSKRHVELAANDTEAAFNKKRLGIANWLMPAAAVSAIGLIILGSFFNGSDYSHFLSMVIGSKP